MNAVIASMSALPENHPYRVVVPPQPTAPPLRRDDDIRFDTSTPSDWTSSLYQVVGLFVVDLLSPPQLVFEPGWHRHEWGARREHTLSTAQTAALAIRDSSGLDAERLGAIFSVERESFQRWLSGRVTPTVAKQEQLFALQHLFEDLSHRVPDPRAWLLSPGVAEGVTPHKMLCEGRLSGVARLVAQIERPDARRRVVDSEGQVGTTIRGSLRALDDGTPEDEWDDSAGVLP